MFLDGYDAHFSTVLDEMKESHIYVFFLRSNNSSNDQPNDCGLNGFVEGKYNNKMSLEKACRPGLPITHGMVNTALMHAWREAKKSAGSIIVNSFRVSGICPLNRYAENHTQNAIISTTSNSVRTTRSNAEYRASTGKATLKRPVPCANTQQRCVLLR